MPCSRVVTHKPVFAAPLMASWLCVSSTSLPLEHTQKECNRLSCTIGRAESHAAACCSNRQHAPSYMRQQAQRRLSARHSVQLRVLCQAGKTGSAAHGESEAEIPQSREEAVPAQRPACLRPTTLYVPYPLRAWVPLQIAQACEAVAGQLTSGPKKKAKVRRKRPRCPHAQALLVQQALLACCGEYMPFATWSFN
jgi:hypothetical protein